MILKIITASLLCLYISGCSIIFFPGSSMGGWPETYASDALYQELLIRNPEIMPPYLVDYYGLYQYDAYKRPRNDDALYLFDYSGRCNKGAETAVGRYNNKGRCIIFGVDALILNRPVENKRIVDFLSRPCDLMAVDSHDAINESGIVRGNNALNMVPELRKKKIKYIIDYYGCGKGVGSVERVIYLDYIKDLKMVSDSTTEWITRPEVRERMVTVKTDVIVVQVQ